MEKGNTRMVRKGQSVWNLGSQHKELVESDTVVIVTKIPDGNNDLVHVSPIGPGSVGQKWSVYYSKTLPA